jgi:hypothetical protein
VCRRFPSGNSDDLRQRTPNGGDSNLPRYCELRHTPAAGWCRGSAILRQQHDFLGFGLAILAFKGEVTLTTQRSRENCCRFLGAAQ